MLSTYSHTNSESLVQIGATLAEIQIFFLGDCFLLAHPVDCHMLGLLQLISKYTVSQKKLHP